MSAEDAASSMPRAMPDPVAGRKKAPRWRLYAPYLLLALAASAWSGAWMTARSRVEAKLDQAVADLRRRGWRVAADGRSVDGFPFRLRVRFAAFKGVAPSGWGLQVPGLEAQAQLYALDHWVLVAPGGFILERPTGLVVVSGDVIRASFAGLRTSPWRVVLEGQRLTFTPASGAAPFPLARASLAQLYLRPTADGSGDGESLLRLEGSTASPGSLLRRLQGDGPFEVKLETRLNRLARFSGANWGDAAAAWAAAGGSVDLQRFDAQTGAGRLSASPGAVISVAADGRLAGSVPLSLQPVPGAPAGPPPSAAHLHPDRADILLRFHDGQTTLGPLRIGPTPRLF